MKSWITVVVIWLIILQSTVTAIITYELNLQGTTKAQYSTFLKQLRDDIKDPNLHYGGTDLPVIRRPMNPPRFLRVDLKVTAGTVSLAIQRTNLYVLAYLAKNDQNKFRAYYFKDKITTTQLNGLFPEAYGVANHQEITYGESYPQIETNAGITRKNAGLGVKKLAAYMAEVNGKPHVTKNEAGFILLVTQMVAETARFKYIEDLVLDNFDKEKEIEIVPDRVIILENNWSLISRATKDSNKGVFKTPLVLKSYAVPTAEWRVVDVVEVNMGILVNVDYNGLLSIIYNNIFSFFSACLDGRVWSETEDRDL
ncbi:hypothetical protein RND81_04G013700 [Saponaria officinalis]|uniref:rRNA N-glycosylase n=1 Tax=Saponaria officinalis TaxID=3572 RepID=A0AAW1LFH6_SAPOF